MLSFALANWYAAAKIDGALPLTEAVLEWHQRLKWIVRGFAIGAVALLMLAAFAGSEVVAIVGGVAVLAWLAVFREVKERRWPLGRNRVTGCSSGARTPGSPMP